MDTAHVDNSFGSNLQGWRDLIGTPSPEHTGSIWQRPAQDPRNSAWRCDYV